MFRPLPSSLQPLVRRTLVRALLCLACAAPALGVAQQGKPQFKQPKIETTQGQLSTFTTAVTQKGSSVPDILYINAPTGTAPNSQVLVGELLNQNQAGAAFSNLGQNQITFPKVSNVVATIADVNSDGKLDYIFALSPTGSGPDLCIYFGTGGVGASGSYSGAGPPPANYPPSGNSGCITFLPVGGPAPNFQNIVALPFQTLLAPQLLLEDTANNMLDILSNSTSTGAGGGLPGINLRLQIPISASDGTGPIFYGDFDHDGNTDFILNGQTCLCAEVYFGNGDGTFKTPIKLTFGHNIHSLVLADMDGDGIPDMLVEGDGGVIEIHKGSYSPVTPFAAASEGGTALGTNALNGDGGHLVAVDPTSLNILTTTPIGLSVLVDPLKTLSYSLKSIYNIGPGRTSYALTSFSGTGIFDFAVDSPDGVAIVLADSNGDGGFQTSNAYAALAPALSSTVGLFRKTGNPNGNVDVVVSTAPHLVQGPSGVLLPASATQAQLLTGDGSGAFATYPGQVAAGASGPSAPAPANLWSNITSGDFNGDGNLDIAYSLTGLPVPSDTSHGYGVYVAYGKGDDTFPAPLATLAGTGAPGNNTFFGNSVAADLNGDGVADLANIDSAYNDTLLSNSGGTPFVVGMNVPSTNSSFAQVAAGFIKVNRLTKQDLIFQQGANLVPYVNKGDGKNFTAEPALGGTPPASQLVAGTVLLTDLDSDGNGDVVAVYYNPAIHTAAPGAPIAPNQLYIWWGNGDGTFAATPQIVNLVRNDYLMAVGDMDNDGRPDLILSDGQLVTVLYNQGSRVFLSDYASCAAQSGSNCGEQHFLAGQGINSISVADVNADGTADLVIANGGATISNPLALGAATQPSIALTPNADVNTGGITVLVNNVTTRPVTGTVVASPEPSGLGATFTLTATIVPNAASPEPTGTVNFYIDGGIPAGGGFVPVLVGATSSTATFVVPAGNPYKAGIHPIQALYSGDTFNSTLTMNGAAGTHLIANNTTTTELFLCTSQMPNCPAPPAVVSPTPIYSAALTMFYGQTWNGELDAFSSDGSALTGSLAINDVYNSGAPKSICSLAVGGGACPTATGTTRGTSVGTNMLTAVYSGDATHGGSTSLPVTITVLTDTVTARLVCAPNPSPQVQPVTCTATFTGNGAAPTGTVTFTLGPTGIPLGTATLVPVSAFSSTATLTTSTLPLGTDVISVNTVASQDFGAATATYTETIGPPLPGSFALSVTPNPATDSVGYSTALTVTVTSLNGLSQAVSLGCGSVPSEAACTFVNPTIAAGGGTTTLFFGSSAPHACGTTQPYFAKLDGLRPGRMGWLAGPVLAGLFAIFVPGRRRWLRLLVALVAVGAAAQMLSGCSTCTDLGTKPGTYTFQVTGTTPGTANSAPQSQTVTVTVNVTI